MLTIFFLLDVFVCAVVTRQTGFAPSLLMLVIFLSGFISISGHIGVNALAASIYPTDMRFTGLGRRPGRVGLGHSGLLSNCWSSLDDRCYRCCFHSVQ